MARTFNAEKQVRFAVAVALTQTAKEAQKTVLADIGSTFTLRNNWSQPSSAVGIKALPATKTDLSAAVVTKADWLIEHETGEDKVPEGRHLTVPSANVRRTKRDIVARVQRPRALRNKRDVVLPLKGGGLGLFQRRGRGKGSKLVFLYTMTRRARIRRQPTVVEPTVQTFEKKFDRLLEKSLRAAFRTAR